MRIFLEETVFDAALDRLRWLFDNYNVAVSSSGGKDSTALVELALIVAREKGALPLKVVFLDQEAEYQSVIDYMKWSMEREEVEPHWYQVPFRLFNSNSMDSDWLHCWDEKEKDKWIHPKVPYSIHENTHGVDRFKDLFVEVQKQDFPDNTVFITGVRAEESPSRMMGLTRVATDKGRTWGKVIDHKTGKFTFHPLYDWSYTDIWKAIHTHKWNYCRIYDKQYSLGVPLQKMRVSSLCHEVSSTNLKTLHEFEAPVWNRLVRRLGGIATAGTFSGALSCPAKLPYMFDTWREYRDYLAEHLLSGEGARKIPRRLALGDKTYGDDAWWMRTGINTILTNDHFFTKIGVFQVAYDMRRLK